MECLFCQKKLRIDNTIGYCYLHRNKSKKVLDRISTWQKNNPDKRSEHGATYYENNIIKIAAYAKNYQKENKDLISNRNELYKPIRSKNDKLRRQTDICFRLSGNLRNRLRLALKRNSKKGSAVRGLGCTIEEFKIYLEKNFLPGMTWENYGRFGWHVDHIKPLSLFDLTDPAQLKLVSHYTNLTPLWWKDNISKGGANRR